MAHITGPFGAPIAALSGMPDRYKIKLKIIGVRLIYQVQDDVTLVAVVAVAKRGGSRVYVQAKTASTRLSAGGFYLTHFGQIHPNALRSLCATLKFSSASFSTKPLFGMLSY